MIVFPLIEIVHGFWQISREDICRIFPGWNHRHYPALAAILAELAPRYGMDYRCIGYRELLQQQQRFLRAMGQQPL